MSIFITYSQLKILIFLKMQQEFIEAMLFGLLSVNLYPFQVFGSFACNGCLWSTLISLMMGSILVGRR